MLTPREIVYINGGDVYKSTIEPDFAKNYILSDDADPIFRFVKVDGKRYLFTTAFKSFFEGGEGASLEGIDLCPDVTLWICLGATTPQERSNYDLFFAIDSTSQLRAIADYYGLPYPVTADVGDHIDRAPEELCFWNAGGKPVVPGGVKFVDGKPVLLKAYIYPNPFGIWRVWMFGKSFYGGGKLWEDGASYITYTGGKPWGNTNMRHMSSHMQAEILYSERADGVKTRYMYTRREDPFLQWRGEELADDGTIISVKRYESSQQFCGSLLRSKMGVSLDDYDLCGEVDFWIGKATCEFHHEVELLFAMTGGTNQLQKVADYYGLPVPFDKNQKEILNTNPELYRARHYDIFKRGPGNWFPIVVCSIVLEHNKPSRFLMYTFMRQWETYDDLQCPAPVLPESMITK